MVNYPNLRFISSQPLSDIARFQVKKIMGSFIDRLGKVVLLLRNGNDR